jgi:parallel beta-helix repeat protein
MKAKKNIFLLLFCGLIAVLIVGVSASMASAKTWHVDDDFADYPASNFSSIQDAIDAADPGDTVFVHNGRYYENVIINKPLKLTGESKESIIHSGWYGTCVKIMSSKVSIDGFAIKYSGADGAGVYVSSNNNIIANNTIIENGYGIKLLKLGDDNTIMNNIITNNSEDIYSEGDSNNILNNTIGNIDLSGYDVPGNRWSSKRNRINNNNIKNINIELSDYNMIANNHVTGGIDLKDSKYTNIINNSIKAGINLLGYRRAGSRSNSKCYNIITNNNIKAGIHLRFWSDYNKITNNTVKSINLEGSSNNKILNNTISQSNGDGVNTNYYSHSYKTTSGGWLVWESRNYYSEHNEIANNNINLSNGNGIYLGEKSLRSIIINNSINSNKGCGIYLHASNYSNIANNRINSNQKEGIYLYQSSNNNLTNNEMNSNKNGTYLTEESGKNQITNNSIKDNEYGIYLSSGSSLNKIYHNNFINNTAQAEERKSINRFDNGPILGGNYWSDHECEGNPSNGTQPYLIPIQNNHDKYPFEDQDGWL